MLDLIILYVIINRDLTMYSIQKNIRSNFGVFTNPSFGAIRPALTRLEKKGYIKSAKIMSEGGKLSVFYSITKEGLKGLTDLLLQHFSSNPIQFIPEAKIKLSCASFLGNDERLNMFSIIKEAALLHKVTAENIMKNEYNPLDFYQKMILDNTMCEYKNLISLIDGLEKA